MNCRTVLKTFQPPQRLPNPASPLIRISSASNLWMLITCFWTTRSSFAERWQAVEFSNRCLQPSCIEFVACLHFGTLPHYFRFWVVFKTPSFSLWGPTSNSSFKITCRQIATGNTLHRFRSADQSAPCRNLNLCVYVEKKRFMQSINKITLGMHKDHILYKVRCDRRPVRWSNLKAWECAMTWKTVREGGYEGARFKRDHNFHYLSLSSILDTIGEASLKE